MTDLRKKLEINKEVNKERVKNWKPLENEKATEDPYKTLFVSRLSYTTTEKKLKREFEQYGPIKKVIIIKNPKTDKSNGYGFVEFEHKRDFITAYK